MRSRTTTATTSSAPTSATAAWPASRRARPARSTTGAPCRVARAYSIEEQLTWDELPAELTPEQLEAEGVRRAAGGAAASRRPRRRSPRQRRARPPSIGASTAPRSRPGRRRMPTPTCIRRRARPPPPWSATSTAPRPATRTRPTTSCSTSAPCRSRCWRASRSASSRPAPTPAARPHFARQYSIASPRNGERPGYNNMSLTVKRVLEDHQGKPVRGVASNYVCDLKVGDKVQVIGPFGASFLMPNHPKSHIVMICTGTGSAPMRAMTEWRRRLRKSGKFEGGKLMLFFGARTQRGAAVLRPAADPAEGLHRHQLRVLAHAGPAQALRAGPDARARRRPGRAAAGCRTPTSTSAA